MNAVIVKYIFQSNQGPPSYKYKISTFFCLSVFFLIGAVHWILFFNCGRLSFQNHDWPKEYKYYSIFQQALRRGTIPYYVSDSFQDTNRFLAIPETVLSPQIFLLKYLKIGSFLIAHFLLLYTIGFIGCLFLKKRFNLSIFTFGILYLLFNFNGHITSHLSVGHSMWGGYFFLPFFFLLLFKFVEGKITPSTTLQLAFILFLILLQGSFHIYNWCLIFLLFLGFSKKKYIKPIFFTIAGSFLFSAFRILPAMVTFFNKKQTFISGYHTIQIFLDSLITIHPHTYWLGILKGEGYLSPGWWEYDLYIGALGVGFILFGLYKYFLGKKVSPYNDLRIPIIGQTILSFGAFYAFISVLPFPFLSSERVSTRFFIIPFLLLIIISAIYLQEVINASNLEKNQKMVIAGLVGLIQMGYSLFVHSVTWSLVTLDKSAGKTIELATPFIINNPTLESVYEKSIKLGFIISITSVVLFCIFLIHHYSHFWPIKFSPNRKK